MTSTDFGVVIWEFCENLRWIPYAPHVTQFIEQKFASVGSTAATGFTVSAGSSANGSGYAAANATFPSIGSGICAVNLVDADPLLKDYVIDFNSMAQIQHIAGASLQVRTAIQRSVHPSDSPAAQGVSWQWSMHALWNVYDLEAASTLEKAYKKRHDSFVDLSSSSCGLPYVVDFSRWKQKNINTGFERDVRRVNVMSMPKVSATNTALSSVPGLSSSVPASHLPSTVRTRVSTRQSAASYNSIGTAAGNTKRTVRAGLGGAVDLSTKKQKSNTSRQAQAVPHSNGVGGSQAVPHSNGVGGNAQHAASDCDIHSVLKAYSRVVAEPPADEDCCICCEKLSAASGYCESGNVPTVIELSKCKHAFHEACVCAMYKTGTKDFSLQCPICKTIYGEKMGCCPNGDMRVRCIPDSLPGHSDCGTILITYNFRPGIQDSRHPNPGNGYHTQGFPRHCYLPDNNDGNKILRLLRKAWDRKLTFTIGTSVTSGQQDTIVWNEIHHKTEFGSNLSGHGYPDVNYVDNVLAELAAQGIRDDSDSTQHV